MRYSESKGQKMLGDLARSEHSSILIKEWTIVAVKMVAVGVTVDCPTHQPIACHQVQNGRLLLMKKHKSNGSTLVKWGTSRPQK